MRARLGRLRRSIQKFVSVFITHEILRLIMRLEVKHVYGPKRIEDSLDELIVLCVVRDGVLYIKSFMEHYLSLGVKHFIFLDNNSRDSTLSMLQNYKNVTILRTRLPYKVYYSVMKKYLVKRFGKDRWSLCVDIDELFDYPFSDAVSLNSLLNYLNKHSYTAVVAQMLDMFSDKPLSSLNSTKENSLKDCYKYYDISNITRVEYFYENKIPSSISNKVKRYYNGIRATLFGTGNFDYFFLTKHPLVFLDHKLLPIDDHSIDNAHVADFTCVLLHYKFLSDFYDNAQRAVEEGNHYDNSAEYKKYYAVLQQNPNLQIKQETACELKNVNDLIDNKFLIVSQDYLDWVEQERVA